MYIRWFAVVFIVSLLYACSPYNGGGELTGTRKTKKWFEPQPYGMVLIPTGSLNIGNNDEDITWAMSATSKTVSIQAFWMKPKLPMMNTGNLSGGYSILSAGSVLPTKDMTSFW